MNKKVIILVLFLIILAIGFGILYKRHFIEPFATGEAAEKITLILTFADNIAHKDITKEDINALFNDMCEEAETQALYIRKRL